MVPFFWFVRRLRRGFNQWRSATRRSPLVPMGAPVELRSIRTMTWRTVGVWLGGVGIHVSKSPPTLLRALKAGASLDDLLVIEGSGAYCSSMATKNYNSFPEAPEVMLDESGKGHLIRKKQEVTEIWANEVTYTPA